MKNHLRFTKNRIGWVDYAKGICIVAVVTMYTTGYVEDILHARGWMRDVVNFAQPFRMPDFFLISGLFVSQVINRPWRTYLDTKLVHFFYFYALWATIKFIIMDGHSIFSAERHNVIFDYLLVYVQPQGPLWFIYILPLFFIATKLMRSLPVLLVLIALILLKLADIDTGWKMIDRFCFYFIFFYAGHIFSRYIISTADWAQSHKRIALAILFSWAIFNFTLIKLGISFLPIMQLLAGFAGAVAIILLSALLTSFRSMQWLRYLGEHSIVVYLGFVIPLALMRRLIAKSTLMIDPGTVSLIVVMVSIMGALTLYWAVRNTPFRFLFARPEWVSLNNIHLWRLKKEA